LVRRLRVSPGLDKCPKEEAKLTAQTGMLQRKRN